MPSSSATPSAILGIVLTLVLIGTLFVSKGIAMASLGAFVIAIMYFSYTNRAIALLLFLSYAAMEGMYKYLTGFSQVVYAVKPLLVVLIVAISLTAMRMRKFSFKNPPLGSIVALLAGWGAVVILHPTGCGLFGSVSTYVVWYLSPLALMYLTYNYMRETRYLEMFCYFLVTVGAVVSVFSCVQFAMGQAWTMAHLPGYNLVNQGEWWVLNDKGHAISTSWRPAGTTSMGGGGGLWSQRGLIAGIGLLLYSRIPTPFKPWLYASLVANLAGLMVSGCRLYVIVGGLEVGILILMLSRTPRAFLRNSGAIFVLCTLGLIASTVTQNISGGVIAARYAKTLDNPLESYSHDRGGVMWRGTMMLSALEENPFGVGYQRGVDSGRVMAKSDMVIINRDDEFNSIAADYGIPGVILLFALIAGSMAYGLRIVKTCSTTLRPLAAMLLTTHCGNLIMMFGGPVLQANETFWMVLGLLLAIPILDRNDAKQTTRQAAI